MIAMRPIREYDVIDLLNAGRFPGDVEGYIVMNGPEYLGHMLYRVDGAVTRVLDCGVENTALVDGAVRACVAAGEHAGASAFEVEAADSRLAEWRRVFFGGEPEEPIPNEKLFGGCAGHGE
ncbi:MAG: hypothetical protein HDT26_02625 [Subdoligranulum sp.]|nr:hypothetical protein [Subdoligranulum sp.]